MIDDPHTTLIVLQLHMPIVQGQPPSREPKAEYTWGEVQTQYSLHHPRLLGVPMVRRNQYGYTTPTLLGSPWWGEINLVRSGCGGNEQKMEENW